jgi:hypothetical protein
MKSSFQGYYSPDANDLKVLWSKGIFVFDTNVLLHLYRVPEATRTQMLSALRALKGRIWLPRHVGIEYQRRRLEAIHTAHYKAAAVLKEIDKSLDGYQAAVHNAELEKRGVKDADAPLEMIRAQALKVRETVAKTLAGQLSPTDHDVIRDEVDALFEGRVGPAPENQAQVSAWDDQGKERFAMKRGPGFEDAAKAEGNDASFYAQGLVYQRQFGDLYIWLQLLNHVRSEQVKDIVFVTQDGKEDWWRLAPGKDSKRARLAPLESLAEEVRAAGADRFWMYQLDTFLREAEKQLKVKVSDLTIEDAQQADSSSEVGRVFKSSVDPKPYGAPELHQFLMLVADELFYEDERIVAGVKRGADGEYSAEIVVLPSVGFKQKFLKTSMTELFELLDLLVEVKRINAYVLTRAQRRTSLQMSAVELLRSELTRLAPGINIFVCIGRFGGSHKNTISLEQMVSM